VAVGLLLEWAQPAINSTHLNLARVWSRGLNISGRCHTFQLCVHVVFSADGNSSVSASSSYKAVSTSLIDSRQSLPLVVVYVTLTAAALSVVASLLLQLDVIVSRRPPSAAAAVSCRSVATLVAWCWRRAGSLSMFTPLVIYIGIIDAFVACEFTAVCLTLCVVFQQVTRIYNENCTKNASHARWTPPLPLATPTPRPRRAARLTALARS